MSVTAVPLRPLTKGTVAKLWIGILLVLLLGAGLAWIGTSSMQFNEGANGIRWRVWNAGTGDPLSSNDLAFVEAETRGPNGLIDAPATTRLTLDNMPEPLRPYFEQMRSGGIYQIFVPVAALTGGQPLAPDSPIRLGETAEFRFRVHGVIRGGAIRLQQEQMQQQMQQQQMLEQLQQQQSGGAGAGGAEQPSAATPGRRRR